MASRGVCLWLLFMIIKQSVGEDMRSVRMSLIPDSKFQCANTTCLSVINVITSNIKKCQVACLTQSQCRAATFHRSTSNCELFADMLNQNENMLADVDATSMNVISGTRFPPEPTTTSTSTTSTTSSTTLSTTSTTSSTSSTSTTTTSSTTSTTTTSTTTTTTSTTTTTTSSTTSSTSSTSSTTTTTSTTSTSTTTTSTTATTTTTTTTSTTTKTTTITTTTTTTTPSTTPTTTPPTTPTTTAGLPLCSTVCCAATAACISCNYNGNTAYCRYVTDATAPTTGPISFSIGYFAYVLPSTTLSSCTSDAANYADDFDTNHATHVLSC
ncbi:unnamed protein product [Adineta steineri]|uniref:Apple domain-containing protein n=1 Tax=Adineta steineri TaxID=433720 RepID=A0A818H1B6_9BILA|nr:unnamed protein product [Adineta steineri]CAF3500720.1 unnamed protein product [Adineta steineri]